MEEIDVKRLTIGVDLRNFVTSFSGIPRYTYGMLSQLALRHDVRAYAPAKLHLDVPALPPYVSLRTGNFNGVVGRSIWSSAVVRHWAKEDRIDVFWGPAHRLPLLDADLPKVLTVHDMVWIKAPSTMTWTRHMAERLLMRPAVASANVVTAVSKSTAKDISEHYRLSLDDIPVIYPGVTSFVTPPSAHKPSRRFALFVGTFEPRKNLIGLVNAYASLSENIRQDCKLVIVGRQGWKMPDLYSYVASKNLLDGVEIRVAEDAELAMLYATCEFLVMPSFYEGFGLPIIEANFFGAPVLTSNLSSMPEVGGHSAHLINPYSCEDIADGLRRMITDKKYLGSLASRAVANAYRFSWKQSALAFEQVLTRAVNNGQR